LRRAEAGDELLARDHLRPRRVGEKPAPAGLSLNLFKSAFNPYLANRSLTMSSSGAQKNDPKQEIDDDTAHDASDSTKETMSVNPTHESHGSGRASPPSEPAERNSSRQTPSDAPKTPNTQTAGNRKADDTPSESTDDPQSNDHQSKQHQSNDRQTPNPPPAGDRESYGDKAHHSNDGQSKNAPSSDSQGSGHTPQGSEPSGKNWTRTPPADAPKTQNSQHGGDRKSGGQSDDSDDGQSTGVPSETSQKHSAGDQKHKTPESEPSSRQ
jgi:hypothetical protein